MNYATLLLACFLLFFSCKNNNPSTSTTTEVTTPKQEEVVKTPVIEEKPEEIITPPIPDYDTTLWADIAILDPSIALDIRYATENNFMKEQIYECPRCLLRPEVAKEVVKIHKQLQEEGLGLKMFDCYRPRPSQWKLWNKVPDPRYVTDPRKGSMHNRGLAVDLTIVDKDGAQLDMGTPYDFFGEEAYPGYTKHPKEVLENRKRLKSILEKHNFRGIRTEWWHFSYKGKKYPLADMLWQCK